MEKSGNPFLEDDDDATTTRNKGPQPPDWPAFPVGGRGSWHLKDPQAFLGAIGQRRGNSSNNNSTGTAEEGSNSMQPGNPFAPHEKRSFAPAAPHHYDAPYAFGGEDEDEDTDTMDPFDASDEAHVSQPLLGSHASHGRAYGGMQRMVEDHGSFSGANDSSDADELYAGAARAMSRSGSSGKKKRHHRSRGWSVSDEGNAISLLIHRVKQSIKTRPDVNYDDYSTIDWARDTTYELKRKKNRLQKQAWYRQALDAVSGWLLIMSVGATCGLFAGFIDIGAEWLSDIKDGVCKSAIWLSRKQCCWAEELAMEDEVCTEWYTWGELAGYASEDNKHLHGASFAIRFITYIAWAGLFGFLCTLFVKRIAPYAAGSGIPEVKTILSGFIIRDYFSMWTLAVKAVGMVLAVAAGLSLGKEGPLVHVACCCGDAFAYFIEKFRLNEAKRREVLSAASAAGVSVAFGAPIGGVLFSLEEVSYYFPHKTLWRSFFAAMVGAIVLSNINPFRDGKIVKFSVHFDYPWYWFELIPFLILGIFGGLYGAIFSSANIWWCKIRKKTRLKRFPTTEVLAITIITAMFSYPNLYTKLSAADVIASLFSECTKESVSALCTHDASSTIILLLLAGVFKMIITVFTFGINVPSGLFIPTMFVGATFGRVVGILTDIIVRRHAESTMIQHTCPDINTCVTPGLYAMVGAAAALGGVTRMTVSLVVIMFELTGGLTYILPLMLAVLTSKWVGDAFNKEGVYDRHIDLKEFPFLDNKHEFAQSTIAKDILPHEVLSHDYPLVCLPLQNLTIERLERILKTTTFIGFPVVNNLKDMLVIGYALRKNLQRALDTYLALGDKDKKDICIFSAYVSADDTQLHTINSDCLDLSECVEEDVFQVASSMPVSTVLQLFRRLGLRQALVVQDGRLYGIITKKDLITHVHMVRSGHFVAQRR